MTLSLLLILCLSGCGRKEASLGTESTAITETSDAAAETRFLINGAEELTDEQIDTALKRWIEYSENLRKVLGFTKFGEDREQRGAKVPPQILEALMKAVPVFNSQIEARFFSSNNYIKASGAGTD